MDDLDKKNFGELLDGACLIYGKSFKNDEDRKKFYRAFFQALIQYPIHQVTDGFNRHMADTDGGKFMPRPADIISAINFGVSAIEQTNEQVVQETLEEWGIVPATNRSDFEQSFETSFSRIDA